MSRRKTAGNAGIISPPLGKHIFSCNYQCRLRRLQVGIGFERSLKANPDLKAAQAALIVARENMLAQRGAYYPSVTGGFSATHAKSSADISPVTNTSALTYTLYTPQVSVSFVPDVFGLNRRTVESLQAQEQQARFALAATHI